MKVKNLVKIFVSFTFLYMCACMYVNKAEATFTLSVTPYEGGYDLRFGRVSYIVDRVNREVIIDVNTDIGTRYQVIQSVLEPLSNNEGDRIRQSNFLIYGIRGTNRVGTLNVEQEIPVSIGRQVLYTSNSAGEADSFTLVYSIIPSPDILPGSYRGRIAFDLEPIDSTQDSVTVILNIFAEVDVESKVEIKTETGSRNIILKFGENQEFMSEDILFNIKGGFGKEFKIFQEVTQQPISNEGNYLDWEAVNFIGSGAEKGSVISNFSSLSDEKEVIYNSSVNGEADRFIITYILADLPQQKAGIYRTSIRYFLEGMAFAEPQFINSLDFEIEYPAIFELVVTPEIGSGIEFRNLKSREPPRTSEITLQVKSNLGKPYQVSQRISSLFVNKEGEAIPEGYFKLKTESLDTKGILKYPKKESVNLNEMVLLISDEQGSPDTFKVIYELSLPPDLPAGDYSTLITYSILER